MNKTEKQILKLQKQLEKEKAKEKKLQAKETQPPKPKKAKIGWFSFKEKAELKKQRIMELMTEYDEFAKINKDCALTKDDRKAYLKQLTKLNLKKRAQIGKFQEMSTASKVKPKYSMGDRWHKLDVKNAIIVRIYYKNNSSTDYVVAKHTRILHVGNFSYIFPPNKGVYDNKHKKTCYSYYQNNPFPIQFGDDFSTTDGRGNTFPDAELLKKTLKFEYAQKLAASEMSKKMDLTFIFSVITAIMSAATLLICVKGFELI